MPKVKKAPAPSAKRVRPRKVPAPYPPPPPPPPPPVNNPYYKKFFEDYWKKYAAGYAAPPLGIPPPPPGGVAFAKSTAIPLVPPPPTRKAPATRDPKSSLYQEEYPIDKTDRQTFVLATPDDAKNLSEKQCYVRTRLTEIFLSVQDDVDTRVRGRKANFVGQVGLRCVFCVPSMDPKDRVERGICYPTCIAKFYQTVQDMQHFHFSTCPAIPLDVRQKYQNLRGNMNSRRADEDRISPKQFWSQCCEEVGLVDVIGDDLGNTGVKLREEGGHGLVERAKLLPDYAKELFMPPEGEEGNSGDEVNGGGMEVEEENKAAEGEEEETGKDEEMDEALSEAEVNVGEDDENTGGFDKLVAELDDDQAEKDGDDGEEEEGEEKGGEEEEDADDGESC